MACSTVAPISKRSDLLWHRFSTRQSVPPVFNPAICRTALQPVDSGAGCHCRVGNARRAARSSRVAGGRWHFAVRGVSMRFRRGGTAPQAGPSAGIVSKYVSLNDWLARTHADAKPSARHPAESTRCFRRFLSPSRGWNAESTASTGSGPGVPGPPPVATLIRPSRGGEAGNRNASDQWIDYGADFQAVGLTVAPVFNPSICGTGFQPVDPGSRVPLPCRQRA